MKAGALLALDAVGPDDRPLVGGKAFVLARLRQAGFPVPDGVVVPAGAAVAAGPLRAACAALGGRFAVRSSSTAEDLEDASFAGQYRTELAVAAEDVPAAVLRCRAAAPRAGAYAAALGAAAGEMAVLVQRFVEPRAAGVVFTRHPRRAGALLVEASAGRGEAVVSGQVTPEAYEVDRASRTALVAPDGPLDADALRRVADLALAVEERLGAPQDVEWALDGAAPVLLQSRPITVDDGPARDPRVRRLTRANVGEVLPGPVTPLTADSVVPMLEHAFTRVAGLGGLHVPDGPPYLVVHDERLYLNLDRAMAIATGLPGVTAADAERLVLGGGAASGPSHVPLRGALRAAALLPRLLSLDRTLPSAIEDAMRTARALESDLRALDDPAALAGAFLRAMEAGRAIAVTHVATSGASGVRLALLGRLLLPLGEPVARVNRLMGGLEDVESTRPTEELEGIAAVGREDPATRLWLAQPADRAAAAFLAGTAPFEVARALEVFLERYGHRALSEGELSARAWADDPTPVIAALQALAAVGAVPGFTRRAAAAVRDADEDAAAARLSPVRAAAFALVLGQARDWVRRRERTKSIAIRVVHAVRGVVRRAGAVLAARGLLDDPRDAFFLRADELRAALGGTRPSLARLRRRQRRYARALVTPAPREVDLQAAAAPTSPDGEDGLAGLGVSAGVVVGRARLSPFGAPEGLGRSDVLVVPALDAALGPALVTAAGAIAEMGGMLSHGAVVARELGVPCVVDVRGAMARIPEGARVRLDGTTGRVEVLDEAGEGAPAVDPGLAPVREEAFGWADPHPQARESIYANGFDPRAGVAFVGSVGVRSGARGEALLAIRHRPGRVLFALDRGRTEVTPTALTLAAWRAQPGRIRYHGRMADLAEEEVPPGPAAALLAPRTAEVEMDLALDTEVPPIDFCDGLPEDVREAVAPMGSSHVEQAGRWRGTLRVDGHTLAIDAAGTRDHSRGRRDWSAADWWRLFAAPLGPGRTLHAMVVSVRGRVVQGGFLWRGGRAERITRVQWDPRCRGGRPGAFVLEVSTADGPPLRAEAVVQAALTVPVDPSRRLWRHLASRPWALVLHENFTRYLVDGTEAMGIAEFTERPR